MSKTYPSGKSISCISINPVYKTSSVTWLTVIPVRSDMATRVCLMSSWMVAGSKGVYKYVGMNLFVLDKKMVRESDRKRLFEPN